MDTPKKLAICVDLDNTLLQGDTLIEAALIFLKQNILHIFLLLSWLFRGKLFFKNTLADHVDLDPKWLIYNEDVITWIKQKKSQGHPIYLVTGTSAKFAKAISHHLKLFDNTFSTTTTVNLTGKNKADFCRQRFGDNQFIYLGNCKKDLLVWAHAHEIICVSYSHSLITTCRKLNKPTEIIRPPKPTILSYLKAIRVHQYSKNTLLFLPILLGSHIDPNLWLTAILAFIAFSATCSAVYIINDLYDLNADRQHNTKCKRAFASGLISIPHAVGLFIACLLVSLLLQLIIHNTIFSSLVLVYFILSFSYSQWLKKIAVLDVMVLTLLYSLRIVVGMVLLDESISHWFLSFAIFFFLSLSYLKRYIELTGLEANLSLPRRGYQQHHELFVKINGLTTGCASIVIFLLYISSAKATHIYSNSNFLYLVAFAIFYWLQRIWLLAASNKVHADPVIFALKDKASYFIGVISILAIGLAHTGI